MSLNLFKSKETSDLIEYNLRIVLCSKAIEGYSCNETEIKLKFDCSVAALIFVCADFACMQELFIENIKTRKQFPPLPFSPKHKPAFLAAVPQAVSDVSADCCSLDQQLRNTDPELTRSHWSNFFFAVLCFCAF